MKNLILTALLLIAVLLVGGIVIYPKLNYNSSQLPDLSSDETADLDNSNNQNINSSSKTYTVDISGFVFSPKTLIINKEDTVTWINMDSAPHTVTSDSGSELDSGTFTKGESYSHTFNSAGEFDYHCAIHTAMKGKIIVQ